MTSATPLSTPVFSAPRPADDLLHPIPVDAPRDWTETYYIGCNPVDSDLNVSIYAWFHPALRLVSSGVFCWRGPKAFAQACEYYDYQHFLAWPEGAADGDIQLSNGLRLTVDEPLGSIRVRYEDTARDTALDLQLTALQPPILRPDRHNFIQPVRSSGRLRLRGEEHHLEGFYLRDRSFGLSRSEKHGFLPVSAWMGAIFGEDFAFHLTSYDDPSAGVEDRGKQFIRFGCLWRNGEPRSIVHASRITHAEADGVTPVAADLVITDSAGETLTLRGEVVGRFPWETWPNILVLLTKMRWTCDGRTGVGDCQFVRYNDHFHVGSTPKERLGARE